MPPGRQAVGMAPADRDWRLIAEEARPGAENMALDVAAAETAADGGPRTLRLYRWAPSTLSLGYGQAVETVDWEFCDREGIDVVRRPTGGGGIYHDTFGDISYSIVLPAEEVPGDLMESYALLMEPILEALDRMGVRAETANEPRPALHEPACYLRAIHPAHDVVVGGRKLSGNAQYRQRNAVIQHGSITFARETERHLGVFAEPGVTPAEFEERVTSVRAIADIDRAAAVDALERALADWAAAEVDSWTDAERKRADEIVEDRFADAEWTNRR